MNYFNFKGFLKKLFTALLLIQGAYSSLIISGKVLDKKGVALAGANVIVVNTNLGAASGVGGYYQLEVFDATILNNPIKLKASYIGYESEIKNYIYSEPINEVKGFNFNLATDVMNLETVVVTGLGVEQETKKLGVSIESVSKERVENSPEVSLVSALRGNVSGLEVRKTSGDAGTNAFFRIRGTGTISGGHEPLVVVD